LRQNPKHQYSNRDGAPVPTNLRSPPEKALDHRIVVTRVKCTSITRNVDVSPKMRIQANDRTKFGRFSKLPDGGVLCLALKSGSLEGDSTVRPPQNMETVMRLGIFALLAASAVGMIAVAADVSTANAQACRKNYYRCDLNRGGRIDPANPNCCWSPLAGPPSTSCPRNFYKCDLNAGGRIDPKHPGCCWNLR
jgi:hypothetical protein